MAEALSKPEVKEALTKAATIIAPSKNPAEAQAFVAGETSRWATIINESGVEPEQ